MQLVNTMELILLILTLQHLRINLGEILAQTLQITLILDLTKELGQNTLQNNECLEKNWLRKKRLTAADQKMNHYLHAHLTEEV